MPENAFLAPVWIFTVLTLFIAALQMLWRREIVTIFRLENVALVISVVRKR